MSFDKFLLAVESRDLSQADKSIIRVSSFPAEWWVAKLLFPSLNDWGLNFLQNECSQSSQIYLPPEKLRKRLLFNLVNFWMIKLTKTSILPNCQVPNSFFWYNCKFKNSFGKEGTLIILLSAWDRSRDPTAKRNLTNDM